MAVHTHLILVISITLFPVVLSLLNCTETADKRMTCWTENVMDLNFTSRSTNLENVTILTLILDQNITVKEEVFWNFPNLQVLFINGKMNANGSLPHITVTNNLFTSLFKLNMISMDSLSLKLKGRSFYVPTLQRISINKCHLEKTPEDVYLPKSLKYLDMSQNSMTDTSWINWDGVYLDIANLSYNHLSTFNMAKGSHSNILTLDLSYNGIVSIDSDTFPVISNLKYLNLKHNYLEFIEGSSLEKFVNMTKLDLSQNILNCSCSMAEFLSWINMNNIELVNINQTNCVSEGERTVNFNTFWQSQKVKCESTYETTTSVSTEEYFITNGTKLPQTIKGLKTSAQIGIIAGVVIASLLLILLVVILLISRYRRFYSWTPSDTETLIEDVPRRSHIRNTNNGSTVLGYGNDNGTNIQDVGLTRHAGNENNSTNEENSSKNMPQENGSVNLAYKTETSNVTGISKSTSLLEGDSSILKPVEVGGVEIENANDNYKHTNNIRGANWLSEKSGESVPMVELNMNEVLL